MRWVWRILGGLVVIFVGITVAVMLVPADRLGQIASDQVSRQLGRDVSLGAVNVSIWPTLGIEAQDVRMANADWADDPSMFEASRAGFGVDTAALLTGKVVFRSIEADAPVLRLIRANGGAVNWQIGSAAESGDGGAMPLITLEKLAITNGTVIYQDGAHETRIENADVTLRWPNGDGPLSIDAKLRPPAGEDVSISAQLIEPKEIISGQPGAVELSAQARGGRAGFVGKIGTGQEAAGILSFDIKDISAFSSALGQAVSLPDGFGNSAEAEAKVTYDPSGTVKLRDGAVSLGANQFTISSDIRLESVPYIEATIRSPGLNLPVSGDSGGGSGTGWSNAAFDASALGAINGQIRFDTDSIRFGDYTIGATSATVSIDNSRAVLDLHQVQAFDGIVKGQIIANNRNGFSTRVNTQFSNIALEKLLDQMLGVENLTGAANGQINVLGSGNTPDALMRSLSGEAAINAGPGVINGIDLAAAITGKADGGTTVFQTLTGNFAIQSGVLTGDDLLLALPAGLSANGKGRVDLGEQSMDYLISVIAAQARDGRGLSFPVRIKGPWDALAIRVDAGEAINQNLQEEKEKLEQKAKDAVTDAISKELDVQVKDGETVEDAVKKKIEDEAAKGILKLLGR